MAEQEQALEIENQDDIALVKRMQDGRDQIVAEIKKVIVGQDDIIDELLIALFGGGHVLVTGVPGLAKTLLIKTVADILQVDFSRISLPRISCQLMSWAQSLWKSRMVVDNSSL